MDMREEFESGWGSYNETQGIYFIPELNMYGCDLYVYQAIADRKSSAWYYFQKGWNASRETLVFDRVSDELYGINSTEIVRCVNDEWCDMLEEKGIKYK